MSTLDALDEQLSRLQDMTRANTRVLHALTNTARAITTRAHHIIRDIEPWEVAQGNIACTMAEMSKVERCYQTPPCLNDVLTRRNTDPVDVIRSMDYLIYTNHYLTASHGSTSRTCVRGTSGEYCSNGYAQGIAQQLQKQLPEVVLAAEAVVHEAFVRALQHPAPQSFPGVCPSLTQRAVLVHQPDALRDVAAVVKRLGENFNRTEVLRAMLVDVFTEALTQLAQQCGGCGEDNVSGGTMRTAAFSAPGSVTSATTSFEWLTCHEPTGFDCADAILSGSTTARSPQAQRAVYYIVVVSRLCRAAVTETTELLATHVLTPLENDYAVRDVPGELAEVPLRVVLARMRRAMQFSRRAMRHLPAQTLLALGGQDVSLLRDAASSGGGSNGLNTMGSSCCSRTNKDKGNSGGKSKCSTASNGGSGSGSGSTLREVLLGALSFVEELWQWRELGRGMPAGSPRLLDYVEAELRAFLTELRVLLSDYVDAKGRLCREDIVLTWSRSGRRLDWMPATDCAVYDMTIHVFHLHKALMHAHYRPLGWALSGEAAIMGEDGSWMGCAPLAPVLCAVTASATSTEADAAVEDYILRGVVATLHDIRAIGEAAVEVQSAAESHGHTLRGGALLNGVDRESDEGTRLSVEVFVVNNVLFLWHGYRREPYFYQPTGAAVCVSGASVSAIESMSDARMSCCARAVATTPETAAAVTNVSRLPSVLLLLEDETERCVDEFAQSWERLFPPILGDTQLDRIDRDTAQPLRKGERLAVKRWYGRVSQALRQRIRSCSREVVIDVAVRARFIEAAVTMVQRQFSAMQDVLQGRSWSNRPTRWTPYTVEQWVEQMEKIF